MDIIIPRKKINKNNKLGELPIWDLTDFYENPDSKKLSKDINQVQIQLPKANQHILNL